MHHRTTIARIITLATVVVSSHIAGSASAADPWADNVIQYVQGADVADVNDVAGDPFIDPTTALGEPTRFTSNPQLFGGAVTPFQAPFRANEVVSIGEGGVLVVAFDEPVVDDPGNPFGIDMLIFGNAFYFDDDFPHGVAGAAATETAIVDVSGNGIDFTPVPGIVPDGIYPTLGYADLTDPFQPTAGSVLTDFTRPVDPTFDPTGLSFPDILSGYGGSGGGTGVDLATVGLSQISFVRITNPVGSGNTPEIDALADVAPVPEPLTALPTLLGLLGLYMISTCRRHVRGRRNARSREQGARGRE